MSNKVKNLYKKCYDKKLISKSTLEEVYKKDSMELDTEKVLNVLKDNEHFDLKSNTMRISLAKQIVESLA